MRDSTRKCLTLTVSSVALLFLSASAQAGLFGDIWDGIKSVVSAPVRAVGWVVGQGVNSAVDPALDNAFGRLRETTDHAIDRFDNTAKARIDQLDAVAKARIEQLDAVAKARIEQVDEVMKRRLDQADAILDDKLNKIESIAAGVLDREARILDQNVSRVDEILNKSLDRLQELETDAFDRVDAALQDQVPFAASQVARSIEWTAVAIIFIVVLVGFGGVQLIRTMAAQPVGTPLWNKFKTGLQFVPQSLLTVGLPMIFLLAVVQTGYVAYYKKTDMDRVTRLEDASKLLELAGDFKSATNFRKRAFALDGKTDRHYMVLRDDWLADFWQKHFGEEPVELSRRLSYLINEAAFKDQADADPELQAANLYMQVAYVKNQGTAENRSGVVEQIKLYKQKFITTGDPKKLPSLGKLVFMAELRMTLDDPSKDVKARLEAATKITTDFLTLKSYERYAPGLVLRAHLATYNLELANVSPLPPPSEADLLKSMKDIQRDADAAFAADPDLVRYVRFRSASLPKDLLVILQQIHKTPAAQRKDLKQANGRPSADVANEQLDAFSRELADLVNPLLGVDTLVRAKVERQIYRAIRSDLGEVLFKEQVEVARKSKRGNETPLERYAKYTAAADLAVQIGKYHLAEAWLNEAQNVIRESPDPFQKNEGDEIKKKLGEVRQASLTGEMFYVF